MTPDGCDPHKSLRTTIRVFLRTEEKKREANQPKNTPPVTPVDAHPQPLVAVRVAVEAEPSAKAEELHEEQSKPEPSESETKTEEPSHIGQDEGKVVAGDNGDDGQEVGSVTESQRYRVLT